MKYEVSLNREIREHQWTENADYLFVTRISSFDLVYQRVMLRRQLRCHGVTSESIIYLDLKQLKEMAVGLGLVPFDPCLYSRPSSQAPPYGRRCKLENGHTGEHEFPPIVQTGREYSDPEPARLGPMCTDLDMFD